MFDRLEFLELFDSEKLVDNDIGATDYSVVSDDLTFTLSVWPLYNMVFLKLSLKNKKFLVCEIVLNNIESIKIDRESLNSTRLLIFKKNSELSVATVTLKPEVSLQCECQ